MSALIRILTTEEANHPHGGCGWWSSEESVCGAVPLFRLATPHGEADYCRDHIDYMIAALPSEWISQWEYRAPVTAIHDDDIPF